MATFLQIVLAVVLVLVLGVVIGWWWIKRRMTRAFGDYSIAAELLDPAQLQPARLQLQRSEGADCGSELVASGDQLRALGFQRMADFEDHGGSLLILRATRHRDLPIAAALIEDYSDNAFFVLFTMDSDKRVAARGNGPGESITTALLDWQIDAGLTPESALEAIRGVVSESSLPIDLRLFRAVYEQVHAVRMDRKIVHRPTREAIEERSVASSHPATDEQIEQAHQIVLEHWKSQIEEAVLDRYRRASKIDAVAWEGLRDEVQVVHGRIEDEDVEALLVVDEVSERIFEQCRAQNLSGMELYQAVARQLPRDQQWTQIGSVERPVRALLFAPNEDIDSDTPAARQFVYAAEDDTGKKVQGAVFAENGHDAKQQIANLGLRNARLLLEPMLGPDELDDLLIDERSAVAAARSASEGIGRSVLRALIGNWWIWAPPAVMLVDTINDGLPLGWGDYAIVAWAALAVLGMVFLIGPMIAYNQLLLAQLKARPGQARICLRTLSMLSVFGGITRSQLTTERCKILAAEGRLDEALALRSEDRAGIPEDEYQAALVSIYDAAGDWPAMMDAQRALLAATPAKDTATVDLAMSMARYNEDADAAEALIQSVAPADLSEVGLIGYQYVRGLLASIRGQYDQALRHYAQSIETAAQFISFPIMIGLAAEINGYAALALKKSGKPDRAQQLWEQVSPILKLHRSADPLVAAYQDS